MKYNNRDFMTKSDFNLLWRGQILTPAFFPCRESSHDDTEQTVMFFKWYILKQVHFHILEHLVKYLLY